MEAVWGTISESYGILLESSIFMLAGLSMAGVFRVLLRAEFVARYFGNRTVKSAVYASLIGVPIPI